MNYTEAFLTETQALLSELNLQTIDFMAEQLAALRAEGGRLFLLGNGGGAAHASHACSDFRILCGIEAYCPSDNIAELTARTNDEGWDSTFSRWLTVSRLCSRDGVFVFSGSAAQGRSRNIHEAVRLVLDCGAQLFGVLGPRASFSGVWSAGCLVVPSECPESMYAQVEGVQAVVWHLLANHPSLLRSAAA